MADVSDLLMIFVKDGKALDGEALTDLKLTKGDMTKGFEAGKMFEVESFKFGAGIKSEDDETAAQRKKEAEEHREHLKNLDDRLAKVERSNGGPGGGRPDLKKKPAGATYEKWRNGQKATYPADIQPVTFSRLMDKASTVLLQNTIDRVTYDSATLIKRKAAGSRSSGEVYLRFDFTGVLMINVSWNDELPVKEDYGFICRAVTVSYRPQLPDGTLGAVIPGFWTMPNSGLQQVNLRGD